MHYSILEVLQVHEPFKRKFQLNIDTIRGTTNPKLLLSDMDRSGWKKKSSKNEKSVLEYTKIAHNIKYSYYPISNSLTIQFSITKLMYGSNIKIFNFDDIILFFQTIDVLISNTVKDIFEVQSFRTWNVTRLDINVDIPFESERNLGLYLDFFKKVKISRMNKFQYKTGDKQKNKSQSDTVYIKKKEIESRDPDNINDEDIAFLNNNKCHLLRYEFQLKRTKVASLFSKDRSVEAILSSQILLELYDKLLVEKKLNLQIFKKDDLFLFIDNNFAKLKARNMKSYIKNLNEQSFDDFKKSHSLDRLNRYRRDLKAHNVNIYYLDNEPSEYVDFPNLSILNIYENAESEDSSFIETTSFTGLRSLNSKTFIIDYYFQNIHISYKIQNHHPTHSVSFIKERPRPPPKSTLSAITYSINIKICILKLKTHT